MELAAAQEMYLLSVAELTALIGTRLYPMTIPADVKFPAMAYQQISGVGISAHNGPTGLRSARIQYRCADYKMKDARKLARLVRDTLEDYQGMMGDLAIQRCQIVMDGLDLEIEGAGGHEVLLDAMYLYREE